MSDDCPTCPTCGQPHQRGSDTPTTWLGQASDEVARPDWTGSRGKRDRSRDRKVVAIAAGLVALWLALVGVARVAAPDEEATVQRAPTPAPTAVPTAVTTAVPTAAPTAATVEPEPDTAPSDQVELALGGEQAGSRSGIADQVERLGRQLGRRNAQAVLGYSAGDSVVLINLGEGTARHLSLADLPDGPVEAGETGTAEAGLSVVVTDKLLRVNGQTVALDRNGVGARMLTDDGSLLAVPSRDTEDTVHWVPGHSRQLQAASVVVLTGDDSAEFPAPSSHHLMAADGVGVLAIGKGRDGETLVASTEGFVPLSPYPVLDANASALLERNCDAEPCRLQVRVADSDEVWDVPRRFVEIGDRFSLAPGGRSLLRVTSHGFAEVYDADNRTTTWVSGAGMGSVAWDPDGTYLAWIDTIGVPSLRLMFLDERDWLSIELAGLPRPVGDALVIFAPAGDF